MVQSLNSQPKINEEIVKPNAEYAEAKRKDREEQKLKKGWRNADEDFGGSFGARMIATEAQYDNNQRTHVPGQALISPPVNAGTSFDQRATVKK